MIDVFFSALGIVLFSPLWLIISLLIKLDSDGPILFKQKRIGKNKKEFVVYKFRTMFQKPKQKKASVNQIRKWEQQDKDPRVTRVGRILRKFALDELPQLINIFKGEMSLVGPRPFFRPRAEKVDAKSLKKRCQVKPGLTSLAVTKGGVNLSEKEILRHDLEYIQKQSLWFDFKIFLKTYLIYLKRII